MWVRLVGAPSSDSAPFLSPVSACRPPGRRRAAANAAGSLGRLPLSRPALFRVLHGGGACSFSRAVVGGWWRAGPPGTPGAAPWL